jgi:hypothetical protein
MEQEHGAGARNTEHGAGARSRSRNRSTEQEHGAGAGESGARSTGVQASGGTVAALAGRLLQRGQWPLANTVAAGQLSNI